MRLMLGRLKVWFIVMFGALGLAFWASLPKSNLQGKTPTQNLSIGSINRVELIIDQSAVVARRSIDGAARWWIEVNPKPAVNQGQEQAFESTSKFIASERFSDYLIQLGKFPAQRELGDVPADRLTDFGLMEKKGSLKIFNSKEEIMAEFAIGKQPYGARSYYVSRNLDGKVLLVGADLIDDLAKPEAKFFERNITKIEFSELREVKFSINGKERRFVRMPQGQDSGIQWADEAAPTQAIPALSLWLEKMGEVRAAAYADDQLSARLSGLEPSLEVIVIDSKSRTEKIEIRTVSNKEQTEYYLITSYLGWPVKVASARAENLLKDLPQILQN